MYNELIIIVKLLIAGLIGFLLGRERKRHNKSGGSRTLAIVSLGGCLIAILSTFLIFNYNFDFTRLMAYAIAGISFIGNGIIVKTENGVDGLTTASCLFVTLILSFCIGLGYYFLGIIGSILMFLILESKYWKFKKVKRRKNENIIF